MRNERGFTLVEIMVAMTIFAFVLTGILLLYVNGYRSYAGTSRRIEVQENLRYALSWMARDIRQAVALDVYGSDGNPAKVGPTIRFVLPDGKKVTYQYDAVQREVETKRSAGDTPHPIASNVSGLQFTWALGRRIVTISITGEQWNTGPITVRTQVHLRAS
ncbi:MAG: PilW family protein [Desulfotomaculales bacterium]